MQKKYGVAFNAWGTGARACMPMYVEMLIYLKTLAQNQQKRELKSKFSKFRENDILHENGKKKYNQYFSGETTKNSTHWSEKSWEGAGKNVSSAPKWDEGE